MAAELVGMQTKRGQAYHVGVGAAQHSTVPYTTRDGTGHDTARSSGEPRPRTPHRILA